MITAIVLAAGTSSRLNTPKQLLDYRGRPLILHTVETMLASDVERVVVVVGAVAHKVGAALQGLPVEIVENAKYRHGQSTSVKAGLAALSASALPEGVLFALGDQPLLKSETVNRLINVFATRKGIIVPYFKNTPGNPVIFAQKYFPELASLSGDVGGKTIIKRYQEDVTRVEVADKGATFDIDTWRDYELLKKL